MEQSNANIGKHNLREMPVHLLSRLHRLRFRFFDHRIDDVRLPAQHDLLLQKAVDPLHLIFGDVFGLDRFAAGRHLIDHRNIQIAIDGEGQCPGNRSRGHHQNVGIFGLRNQLQALHHAEAVLLIDDGQAKILPLDILFDERVSANSDVHQASGHEFF